MQVVNYSEFRKNMKAILDKTTEDKDTVIISRSAGKDVVMISLAEYNSWVETLHLMNTEANRVRLSDSVRNIEAGHYVQHPLIEE